MIRACLACLLIACLSGCANLYAGIAEYKVTVFYDPGTQKMQCCAAEVISGKNVAGLTFHITKHGDDWDVSLVEQSVNGSEAIKSFAESVANTSGDITKAAIEAAQFIK